MKNKLMTFLLVVSILMLAGCAQSIEEIKQDENIGETVAAKGTVEGVIKIGDLSAYRLVDANGDSIGVASKRLPAEGDKVTAKGVLVKNPILGYYIDVDK